MAEQDHGPAELVEVRAEDIIDERRGFYEAFMGASKYAIGATIAVLVLMAIFLV
jgi:flagellar biosynthesis component FlhA